MSTVKGKCSLCGGCVMDATPAYCSNCGAREAGPAERVIEMVPQQSPVPTVAPFIQSPIWIVPGQERQWWMGDVYCESTLSSAQLKLGAGS